MDSIWSTRRYAPVTVDIDLITLKGKKILKAASEKTKKTKLSQQQQQQQQDVLQPLQNHSSHLQPQMDSSEGEPLKQSGGELPTIAPITSGWPRRRPLSIQFSDVTLCIGKKPILQRVCGSCRPGELMAIMGPSSSGKTTLLNTISGRLRPTSGTITIGGEPLNKRHKRQICYVLQDDIFYANLTLRQTLMYTALLRLPDSMSHQDKMNLVDHIIHLLDLQRCQYTNIGEVMHRGLSGGEKKRANIACELLTNPSIMLLDEPTSGLDSSTAYSLISTLKQFAEKEHKTVIVTLHQPSSQIFYMLDRLLLLCNGQNAYFGETKKVIEHFTNLGLPVAPHYNPADFILEQAKGSPEVQERLILGARERLGLNFNMQDSVKLQTSPSMNSLYSKYLGLSTVHTSDRSTNPYPRDSSCTSCLNRCQEYSKRSPSDVSVPTDVNKKTSEIYSEMVDGAEEDSGRSSWSEETVSEASGCSSMCEDYPNMQWPTSFFTQFKVLTRRNFCVARPIMLSWMNGTQTLILALIAGLLWYQAPRTEESLQDIQGWMFFSTNYWMLFILFGALQSFPAEREVIAKERASGSYRVSAYYLAKMVGELPLTFILPTLYFVITYTMMGWDNPATGLMLLFMLLLSTLVAQSVGLLIGAVCYDLQTSITVAAIFTLFTQLFGGYLATRIPPWLSWAKYLSIVHYAYQNMNIIQFTYGLEIRCSTMNSRFNSCVEYSQSDSGTHYIPVDEILQERGEPLSLWANSALLIGFMIAVRLLTYVTLRYLHRPK
ncbi:ABC transporter G family member 21-like isoform X1 [Portunus trituberculatus]|uniref:ABC transporter G family member 21-like isoform X1 n=1 Tax=Portunus trituberculatus TaxID=210409 RepID=UPI001E1CB112|nr:ABC transporter G family member 21-like isoform X1 [Portunus trituberculatus]XP_045112913.1 ABC transporter G family member 21-like isoform X1 [Portunus trituberculatus]